LSRDPWFRKALAKVFAARWIPAQGRDDGNVATIPRREGSTTGLSLDHHDELMANWQHGLDRVPLEMIPGADMDD
jgi:hypothetical protein